MAYDFESKPIVFVPSPNSARLSEDERSARRYSSIRESLRPAVGTALAASDLIKAAPRRR